MACIEELKRLAGRRAAEFVCDGMVVGLGSGSTARYATLSIAERLRQGRLQRVVAIATSSETEALARDQGIPLGALEEHPHIDVTIDGADEVDPALNLIKGLGGYLLREKIVARATAREIIVVDDSKLVQRLGTRSAIPVEVVRFGWRNTELALRASASRTALRHANGTPYVTDEGHLIVDCWYESPFDPATLAQQLKAVCGVVESGLFVGLAKTVVVAGNDGIRVLER